VSVRHEMEQTVRSYKRGRWEFVGDRARALPCGRNNLKPDIMGHFDGSVLDIHFGLDVSITSHPTPVKTPAIPFFLCR